MARGVSKDLFAQTANVPPAPSSHVDKETKRQGDMSTSTQGDTAELPKVKVAVYLPTDVAQALEARYHRDRRVATRRGDVSRSSIVAEALRRYLAGDAQ
jgi:hypothetical protein